MVVKMMMESYPIEEPPEAIEEPPQAITPMEIVSSDGQSAIEEPEAIVPNETLSSGTGRLRRKVARRTESWSPTAATAAKGYKTEGVAHVFRIAAAAAC